MAIALTIAVHGGVFLVLWLSGFGAAFAPVDPPRDVGPVALRALPESSWAQNRQIDPRKSPDAAPAPAQPQRPAEPPRPKPKKPEPLPRGKVVDVPPGNDEAPPEDTRFLAERNNRVEKETVSRDTTLNYRNATSQPTTTSRERLGAKGRDAVDEPVIAGNGGLGQDDAPRKDGAEKKGAFEIPSTRKRDALALRPGGTDGPLGSRTGSDEVIGNSNRLRIQPGGGEGEDGDRSQGRAGQPDVLNLTPSAAVLDRIIGAPPADVSRAFDDLEEGDGTFLNTREFKYSSFFNRVKQHVVVHWNPRSVIRQRDPTGDIYLYKDRYTVVTVTLDRTGILKDIAIDRSSGVEFLDTEAVSAFRRAHRFPNPPEGLTDERGEIRFNFAFGVYVDRGVMQLFRTN